MKMRIKNHTGKLELGYISNREPSKQGKTFAEFDNISPADVDLVLAYIDTSRVSVSKRYAEYFPQLKTF